MLVRLPALMEAVYRSSDSSDISFIAQGLATGHGPMLLPTQTSIAVVWFDELLHWVPLSIRMGVEYWIGPVLSVIAAVVLVRAARIAAGRRAALCVGCALAVLPPVVLWTLLSPDNHITTYVGAALLCWHLVRDLAARPRGVRSVLVGCAIGVFVVSDPQIIVFGLIPWAIATVSLRRCMTRLQLLSALRTALTAVAAVGFALAIMRIQGIGIVNIVPPGGTSEMGASVVMTARTAVWMLTGGWYGDVVTAVSAAFSVLVVGALAGLVVFGREQRRPAGEGGSGRAALQAYVTFWSAAAVCLVAAFIVLGYGAIGSSLNGHYLVGCYFALAALLAAVPTLRLTPAHLSRRAAAAAATALVVFAAYAANDAARTASLDAAQYTAQMQSLPDGDPLPVLLAHHLQRGYAGYWVTYDVDWRARGQLSIWPVLAGDGVCRGPAGSLCPYRFAPQGEYVPARSATFLITPMGAGCGASQPSAAVFGTPTAVYQAGPYTISVYDYDVASRFAVTKGMFC
ncbi:MAG: hypothetical protein JOZ75_03150 [Candidatus Dormibacteraeota bacterium]|nr:hypothetical protein [Candidatus Dormibacteraeota bacterium]